VRYRAGDIVICRSEYGTDYLTKGKEYVVIKGEDITRYFDEVSKSSDLTIVVECDDGQQRPVSKLKFVPATQVVAKRGKLEVLKPARKRD
jgi:hypothetical protein